MKHILLAGLIVLTLSSPAAPQETVTERSLPPGLEKYLAELDRWSAAAEVIQGQPDQAANFRKTLPRAWPVAVNGQQFSVSTVWLEEALKSIQEKPADAASTVSQIRQRLALMRDAAEAMADETPVNASQARSRLEEILRQSEFREVHKRSWMEELRDRLAAWLTDLLERLFGRLGSHANWGRMLLWSLVVFLVALFLVLISRTFFRIRQETRLDLHGPVRATRGWKDWAREALAMAGRGNYREAVHLGYWAGIYRLEELGVWQSHRARTHREYLRLLAAGDGRRPPLAALTSRFETVWYGGRPAAAEDFEFVMKQLEGLGCNINLLPATETS